jgi:hypothetical protein
LIHALFSRSDAKKVKSSFFLALSNPLRPLHCLKVFAACAIFRWPLAIQNRDLLAPRRQERQVRKFDFFAAFAPLREIFRVLVAALPRWAFRGE